MTTLDIFQIVFLVIVFLVGVIGFIKAAASDNDTKE